MKFKLTLNAEYINDALNEAAADNVNLGDATLEITGTVNKKGNVIVTKTILIGTVEQEYVKEL